MSTSFVCLDHVQLAIPVGGEADARRFYCDLLGMEEIPKPPRLVARGGLWLRSGAVVIHLGVEADFRAARKAQTAIRIWRCGPIRGGSRCTRSGSATA